MRRLEILKADPNVEIPWQEIETNSWVAGCAFREEYWREASPPTVAFGSTRFIRPPFFHAWACEYRYATDPAGS
jgi:hypothetical protein